ncbi:InlB B-repeat-containing protein [Paenibacillus sp. N3.4]|uniref:InlB B-repeat-containing protein n=1 Tax=Paenibacillus sp. N3.4 TaxID=2603222 RepID=UPI0011C89FAD|nr:InlB B-repeat-containing protein [Paenibacillus sp. N3.4]TXK85571.1 hypothetical protein FU659_03190 [Paenibacillus sp. N3.4]
MNARNIGFTRLILLSLCLIFIAIGSFSNKAYAAIGVWESLGTKPEAPLTNTVYQSLSVDNGTPYIAYLADNDIYAKKWDGSKWVQLGAKVNPETKGSSPSIYVYNGTPYVAYTSYPLNSNWYISIRKFDGSSWVTVGTAAFVPNNAGVTNVKLVGDNGNLYVLVMDGSTNQLSVMKLVGSTWTAVGNTGFTPSKALDSSMYVYQGTPYVAYRDSSQGDKLTVKQFNGTSWVTVGNAGFSSGVAGDKYGQRGISLTVSDAGVPYVAYEDHYPDSEEPFNTHYSLTVKSFNGSSWVTVGTEKFAGYNANEISMTILNGTPYVAYADPNASRKATVQKFDGSNWVAVGMKGFSSQAYPGGVNLKASNGELYIYYQGEAMKYTPLTYTVTYAGNGHTQGNVPTDSKKYDPSSTVTVLGNTGNLAKTGYTFAGWQNTQGVDYSAGKTFTISANTTLSAKWTINQYTVTFISNGGSTVTNQKVDYNTQAAMPNNPTKLGYTFAGWYTDSNLTNSFNFNNPITGNLSLYAKWTINKYTVSFNSNAGTAVNSQTVDYNTIASKPIDPTKAGHTFAGWYKDSEFSQAFDFNTPIVGDTILFAKWKINQYTVTFNSNGGNTVNSQIVDYNKMAAKPNDPTIEGHSFEGWYTDSKFVTPFDFNTPITNHLTLYAKWTINSYTITFDSKGGSAVASQTVDYNTKAASPAAPAKQDFIFLGWYSDNGKTAFDFNRPITGNVTLYAKWAKNVNAVSFDSNGGSSVDSQNVNYNQKAAKPADPTKTGYSFAGWYADSGLTTAYDFNTAIIEDTTLYAKWSVKHYTVTFDSNGGNTVASQTVDYQTKASEPVPPAKPNFTFVGWFLDSALKTAYDFRNPITDDTTLYAKWAKSMNTVTFDSNGGSAVESQNVKYKEKATKPGTPTKTGYTFEGWYGDLDLKSSFDFNTPIIDDVILIAKWTVNRYTVTYNSNDGSSVVSQNVNYNENASKPQDPTKNGYTFAGWYTDSEFNTAFDFKTSITSHLTLYAKWTINPYTVTFDSNGGSAVASQTVDYNTKAASPAAPAKQDFIFLGWYSDNGKTAFDFNRPITGNVTLYAKWAKNVSTVSFDSNGGSTVDNQSVNYKEKAAKPADPAKTGYTFAGWYVDSGWATAYDFNTAITEDTTLYAKWSVKQYTVSFDSNEGSTVATQTAAYHTKAIEPVPPTKPNFKFVGWYLDSALKTAFDFNSFIIDDVALYAKWTMNQYTITFESNGGSSVGSQNVNYNEKGLKPEDPTKKGYTFAGWYADRGLAATYDFNTPISEHATLYAKWIINKYTVTFDSKGGSAVASQMADYNTKAIAPTVPTKQSFIFFGWYSDNELKTVFDFNRPITENVTLYAKWASAYSTVQASPQTVLADGKTYSTITVVMKGDAKEPLPGKKIELIADSGSSQITAVQEVTNSQGEAIFRVTNDKIENVSYTVKAGQTELEQKAAVTFTAGPIDGGNSSVTASPTIVPADGATASVITVLLKDAQGHALSGNTVSLVAEEGISRIEVIQAESDAAGKALFRVTNTVAEQVTYAAVINKKSLEQRARVTFESPAGGTGQKTSVTDSTVVAVPSVVEANGQARSKVTVTLKDAAGKPVAGKSVALKAQGGSSVIAPKGAVISNASGQAVFTVTGTVAEQVTYQAKDEADGVAIAQTAVVTFEASTGTGGAKTSVLKSGVTASPTIVEANGTAASMITVNLKDANGEPVSGKSVRLIAQGGSSVMSPTGLVVSNAAGQAVFTVTNAIAEQVTYGAKDETDKVAIAETVVVTFEASAPAGPGGPGQGGSKSSVTDSTVIASPLVVEANGTAASTITVTLKDTAGQPVAGKSVRLTAKSGSSVIAPDGAVVSNEAGQAVFKVTNTLAEQVTYSAKDETDRVVIAQTAVVTFETTASGGTGTSVTKSTVTATPATVEANGTAAAAITVTLKDASGQPVAGKNVTLTAQGGSSVIAPVGIVVSDAAGRAVFAVTNTAPEQVTYRAKDETNHVAIAQTATVTFESKPGTGTGTPTPKTSVTRSTVEAAPSKVEANGTAFSTVTVTLKDDNGQPVSGKQVVLQPLSGSSVIAPVGVGVSNAAGQALLQ